MGWLYLRFAAINVENRGTGTLGKCQISAILYADRGYRRTKSPSVSLAMRNKQKKNKKKKNQTKRNSQFSFLIEQKHVGFNFSSVTK